jgi:hypothetical protein
LIGLKQGDNETGTIYIPIKHTLAGLLWLEHENLYGYNDDIVEKLKRKIGAEKMSEK